MGRVLLGRSWAGGLRWDRVRDTWWQGGLKLDLKGPGVQPRRVGFEQKTDGFMAWEIVWEFGFKKTE